MTCRKKFKVKGVIFLMKITISGLTGSGKTTVSKMLAEKLGCKMFYIGGIMREMAKERGRTFPEFTEDAKKDESIDLELDERQRALDSTNEDFVMDSRLGFYFIPNSFKVFLKVDLNEAARRVFSSKRNNETYGDAEECKVFLRKRMDAETLRYKNQYDIEFPDESDFDLVIDTTNKAPVDVVDDILGALPCKCCDKDKC
jgi:CMP/dCMP kinase